MTVRFAMNKPKKRSACCQRWPRVRLRTCIVDAQVGVEQHAEASHADNHALRNCISNRIVPDRQMAYPDNKRTSLVQPVGKEEDGEIGEPAKEATPDVSCEERDRSWKTYLGQTL